MNEEVRKPHSVYIGPEALHKARVEALRVGKSLGEWFEEAIEERVEREEKEPR